MGCHSMSSCDGVRLIANGELPGHRATSSTLHAVSLKLLEVLHLSHRQPAIMSALTAFNLVRRYFSPNGRFLIKDFVLRVVAATISTYCSCGNTVFSSLGLHEPLYRQPRLRPHRIHLKTHGVHRAVTAVTLFGKSTPPPCPHASHFAGRRSFVRLSYRLPAFPFVLHAVSVMGRRFSADGLPRRSVRVVDSDVGDFRSPESLFRTGFPDVRACLAYTRPCLTVAITIQLRPQHERDQQHSAQGHSRRRGTAADFSSVQSERRFSSSAQAPSLVSSSCEELSSQFAHARGQRQPHRVKG